jgi:hypothetical protein
MSPMTVDSSINDQFVQLYRNTPAASASTFIEAETISKRMQLIPAINRPQHANKLLTCQRFKSNIHKVDRLYYSMTVTALWRLPGSQWGPLQYILQNMKSWGKNEDEHILPGTLLSLAQCAHHRLSPSWYVCIKGVQRCFEKSFSALGLHASSSKICGILLAMGRFTCSRLQLFLNQTQH